MSPFSTYLSDHEISPVLKKNKQILLDVDVDPRSEDEELPEKLSSPKEKKKEERKKETQKKS